MSTRSYKVLALCYSIQWGSRVRTKSSTRGVPILKNKNGMPSDLLAGWHGKRMSGHMAYIFEVLQNSQKRSVTGYKSELIHTFVGAICIICMPYKKCNCFN
jgi:hypothetical protein